jgi:hypothetical protein
MINKDIIIITILLTTGFIFLYMDLYNRLSNKLKPKEKIIYRYVPKIPYDELEQQVFPTDIFETMFSQPTPWINNYNDLNARQSKLVNKYFISQI